MIISRGHVRVYHKPGYWTDSLRPEQLPWELHWLDDKFGLIKERYALERDAHLRAEELRDIYELNH